MFIKFENNKSKKNKNELGITIKNNEICIVNDSNNKIVKNTSSKVIKNNKSVSFKDKINDMKFKIKTNLQEQKEIKCFQDRWLDIMYQCNFLNKYNQTYTLLDIKKENFGYSCSIAIPDGYSANMLSDKTETIQNNIECTLILKKYTNKRFINARFVMIEDCNSIPFKPIEVKPYEIASGVNEAGEPIIFNVNIEPQMLIAGATRSGKNGCLDHAIPSWIYHCNENEVNLHLFQFAKGDLGKYKRCRQVKSFVLNDLEKMGKILNNTMDEMKRRTKLLQSMLDNFKGDNLFDYNKLHPDKQLPYIYIIIDEFMKIADVSKDKGEIKDTKEFILKCLQDIAEFGGAYGVNYIIAHQKPEAKLMPTFLKNQSNIRICFGFKDEVCGRIVLGEDRGKLAVGLPPRKAYYISNLSEGYLYTTNLRNKDNSSRILRYIKNSFENIYEEKQSNHFNDNTEHDENKSSKDNNKNNSNKSNNSCNKKESDLEKLKTALDKLNEIKTKSKENSNQPKRKVTYSNKPAQVVNMTVINIPKKNNHIQNNNDIKVNQSQSIVPVSNAVVIKDNYKKKQDKIVKNVIVPTEIIIAHQNTIKINQNNAKNIEQSINNSKPTIKYSKKPMNNIQLEFNKVNNTKTKEEILLENIKKIPGFVPYEPPKVDNTKKKGE